MPNFKELFSRAWVGPFFFIVFLLIAGLFRWTYTVTKTIENTFPSTIVKVKRDNWSGYYWNEVYRFSKNITTSVVKVQLAEEPVAPPWNDDAFINKVRDISYGLTHIYRADIFLAGIWLIRSLITIRSKRLLWLFRIATVIIGLTGIETLVVLAPFPPSLAFGFVLIVTFPFLLYKAYPRTIDYVPVGADSYETTTKTE